MDAVIIAAGEGTRLRPLTVVRPKPMIPVAGKPILEWNIEGVSEFFDRIFIVVGYKKEIIISHFGDKFNKAKIEYIEQKEQLGTANAINLAEEYVKGDFMVMNGDLIVSRNLIKNFVEFKKNKSNVMCLTRVKNPKDFGVVEIEGDRIKNIVEKPEKPESDLVNAGVYFFKENIFEEIEKIGKSKRFEYEITDAIKILIDENNIYGYVNEDLWLDVGKPWDLLDANELLLKSMKESQIHKTVRIEGNVTLKNNLIIGEGTEILSGSYIVGPCFIGKNCRIGPNNYIRAYTSIGDNCHIGASVEIKNSIIMSKTNVPHLNYVGDSVIGERCNFGAGTKIANLRFDEGEVKMEIKKTIVSSGRKKMGAIIADNVKTGINVSIMPGRVIYPNAKIEVGSVVRDNIYTLEE